MLSNKVMVSCRGARSDVATVLVALAVGAIGCGSPKMTAPTSPTPTPTPPTATPAFTLACPSQATPAGFIGTVVQSCTANATANFPFTVAFGCPNPQGVSCSVSPASVTFAAAGSAAISVTLAYDHGLPYGQSIVVMSGSASGVVKTANLPLIKNADTISTPCPLAVDIGAISRDLLISFEGDPTGGTPSGCDPQATGGALTVLQAQTYRALILLREMSFTAPLPWTSETVYDWVRHSIRSIRMRTDIGSSFCCQPADTINVAVGTNSCLFSTGLSPVTALTCYQALVVHETRHNNGFPHTCGGNDQTMAEMGAWAVQYHFYDWIGNHMDAAFMPPSRASEVRSFGLGGLCSRFCDGNCPPH